MPEEFPPSWEYWTPSEEMQEFWESLEESDGFSRLGIEEQRTERIGGNIGFRFGRGRPDAASGIVTIRKRFDVVKKTREVVFRKCEECGAEFEVIPHKRIFFCSRKCSCLANGRRVGERPREHTKKPVVVLECAWCNHPFVQNKIDQRFCQASCAGQVGNRSRHTRIVECHATGRGKKGVCPSCQKEKTIFRRGVCRTCYKNVRTRVSSPVAKRHKSWTAREARVMVLGVADGRTLRDIGKELKRTRAQMTNRYTRHKREVSRMKSPTLQVGQRVTINAPDEPAVHGCEGVVEKLTEWGAHLLINRPVRTYDAPNHTPRWRALWSEMTPLEGTSIQAAREMGFTGDPCTNCGSIRVVRVGTCLQCQDCQSSSGCG